MYYVWGLRSVLSSSVQIIPIVFIPRPNRFVLIFSVEIWVMHRDFYVHKFLMSALANNCHFFCKVQFMFPISVFSYLVFVFSSISKLVETKPKT